MADQLTATGLTIDDYQTRRAAIVASLRSEISAVLDVSPDQPTGQLIDIIGEHVQQLGELLQELHSAIDPDQATGQSLDAVSSITGTYRRAATFGTVELTVNLDAVTTLPAGSQAAVSGDPDNIWETTEEQVSVGAGDYTVPARCTTAGPVAAPAGTITVIVTPVAGWNTVTNAVDATEGLARETDTELRLRRELEVTIGGSTSVDAIQAAVSQIDGVIQVYCIENDTDAAQLGVPPHAFEVIYWDGGAGAASTSDIAEAIYAEKAAGIKSHGSTTETVSDAQGIGEHEIGMTLADEQRILVEVDLDDSDDGTYVGDAAVASAIAAWADANLGIAEPVYRSKISGVVVDLSGVLNVSQVQLSIHPAPVAGADISVGMREIATISSGDVTVNS